MIPIGRRTAALIGSILEIANFTCGQGVANHGMNRGGKHNFPLDEFSLFQRCMVQDASPTAIPLHGLGCRFFFQADGRSIYRAGDTALFQT